MAILHIINKIEEFNNLLLKTIAKEDSVLLIEDALFMLQSHNDFIKRLAKKHQVYGIKQDAEARAVATIAADISMIDYDQFVSLTEEHSKILSWY